MWKRSYNYVIRRMLCLVWMEWKKEMKRKRKLWYDVTSHTPGLWWDMSLRKWVDYNNAKGVLSSHAYFKTKKRAMKNATGLLQKTEKEVIVVQWFYRKGKRYCQEYIAKEVENEPN